MDPNNTSIDKIKRRIERIWKRKTALPDDTIQRLKRIEAAAKRPSPEDVRWVDSIAEAHGA